MQQSDFEMGINLGDFAFDVSGMICFFIMAGVIIVLQQPSRRCETSVNATIINNINNNARNINNVIIANFACDKSTAMQQSTNEIGLMQSTADETKETRVLRKHNNQLARDVRSDNQLVVHHHLDCNF